MKILVLDDSPLSRRRLIAKLSRDYGAEMVRGAGELLEAIGLMREEKFDLVIVDRKAHRRYGIDILKNIKAMSPAPKVLMLTNRFYPAGSAKCLADGVDFCFDKFTEIDQVTSAIRSHENAPGRLCSAETH